ncbi:ATP-dependent DNA helicase II subunit 2 [Rhizopus azygosporus]|uniref:ATP-dependent DNA helicase II subunit 2 n=1 Tax=Rhizopus azygosporus TaxID=86630 RepID=A0A367J1T8_RHIAZ|nr:ATP-dependent DNA helicase II subunit 2 [Rhizopus azygosporus]
MAQKRATVYILNVTESMSHYPENAFQKALDCITASLEDKILSGRKTDFTSILLAGTLNTDNVCADQLDTPDQYQNISTLYPLQQTTLSILRQLIKIQPVSDSNIKVDVLDAVIVAIQMILAYCKKLKYEKCIAVFSNAKDPIDWRDYHDIAAVLRDNNIVMLFNGVDYHEYKDPMCIKEIEMNYDFWIKLASQTPDGRVCHINETYEEINQIQVKEVRPTPSYRGYLYLGSPSKNHFLAISVFMYLRVKEVKMPSSKKYSSLSQGPTYDVVPEKIYTVSNTGESKTDGIDTTEEEDYITVSRDELEKAYRFGKQVVKVSPEEEEYGKLKTKKELSILEFVPASTFRRYYLKGHPYIVSAGSYCSEESAVAISALAHALHETDTLALVRYVYKDDSAPKLGVLFPLFEKDISLLHYVELPFSEDVHPYTFPSPPKDISDDTKGSQLIDELIDTMDLNKLTDIHGNKYLDPNDTFNPIFWRVNKAIKARALDPNAAIPELGKEFQVQYNTPDAFKESLMFTAARLQDHFQIKKGMEKKRKYEQANDEASFKLTPIDELVQKNKQTKIQHSNGDVQNITINTPIDDFKAMSKEANNDHLPRLLAVEQLSKIVIELVTRSFGSQNYQKAIECLQVMRNTAVEEEEAKTFNATLNQLKGWCELSNKTSPRRQFWEMLKGNKLTLITQEESKDADVQHLTKNDALKFFDEEAGSTEPMILSTQEDAEDMFDVDDLLNQME